MYANDSTLPQPYEDKLNAYLNEPAFKALAEGHVFNVAKKIQRAGNRAVHESKAPTNLEAVEVVSALFQFCLWLAFTYGRSVQARPAVTFDPAQAADAGAQPSRRRSQSVRSSRSVSTGGGRDRAGSAAAGRADPDRRGVGGGAAALIAEVAAAKKAAEAMPGRGA